MKSPTDQKQLIDESEVGRVFELSRLQINQSEIASFAADFNRILGFFGKLNEVSTDKIEELAQVNDLNNVFRSDTVEEAFSPQKALANAPDKANGYFKVPVVIEGE